MEPDTPAPENASTMDAVASGPTRKDVDIVANGNINLALPQQAFVRVSSVVLSYASPVFKALLGPEFKKYQEP